jgi:hypothetical protein
METRSWSDVYRVQSEAIDRHLARIAALEAAARAVLPLLYVVEWERGRDWCADCGPVAPAAIARHCESCRVEPFAALLTEAVPSTQAGAGEGGA